MHRYILIIRNLLCLLCLVSLIWGCGKKPEPVPKAVVVKQKITAQSKSPQTPKKSGIQEADRPVTPAADQKAASATSVNAPAAKSDSDPLKAKAPDTTTVEDMEKAITGIALYNPQGKINPFKPLFKDEPVAQAKPKKNKKRRIPQTPLERLDLSQLKLVGVIKSPKASKALVEEASGKGYIISKGTYIGTRAGRVIKINKDHILIEEETEDLTGKTVLHEKELKLQKPAGE